jgi:hypothetical protein
VACTLYSGELLLALPKTLSETLSLASERKLGIFFKIKSKIPDFERGKARILTTAIHSVFRGLKFECDEEIGKNNTFRAGANECFELNLYATPGYSLTKHDPRSASISIFPVTPATR